MIRGIINWSQRFRLLFMVGAAVLLFFGIARIRDMAVDVYPEFGPVIVDVQSEALGPLGAGSRGVRNGPAGGRPPEQCSLGRHPAFEVGARPVLDRAHLRTGNRTAAARQVVQERLSEAAVALAGASKPPQMLQPRSSMTRVMMVGLSSSTKTLIEMSVLARWNIRPRLMGVPGVANVAIWGQREQQLQVLADPAKMQAQRVPLLQVIEATANALWASPLSFVEAAVPGTGGFIDTPNQRIGIQHISPITSPADLAQVTLEERSELRLGDVATVVEDHQPLIGDAILKNGPGLLLVIEKWPDSNTLEVTRGVEEALAAMAPGLSGIEVDPTLYRPATYIEESIDNLTLVMVVAAVLVILVLVAFLFDWRTALLSAITIPFSLLAAVLVVDLLGGTMNLMVLGGLVVALVLLIDDAVLRAYDLRRQAPGQPQHRAIDCGDNSRSPDPGARAAGLRRAHRPTRALAAFLPERRIRRVLPAHGSRLWRRHRRLRGDLRDIGSRPRPGAVPRRAASAALAPPRALAANGLRALACGCPGQRRSRRSPPLRSSF